jgi:hypothetical protein
METKRKLLYLYGCSLKFKLTGKIKLMRKCVLRLCVSNRTLWAVVLVLCLLAAIGMVRIEWSRNDTSPTLIALDTSHYPIWNIDFPAVTFCGINRIQKSRALILSKEWYVRIIISLKSCDPQVGVL